jgi:hypothetical protein
LTQSPAIRWLPLKAAARYAAIGEKRLVSLARSGAVVGFQDATDRRDWIFDARSLDRYREGQHAAFMAGSAEQSAVDILRTAGL